MKLKNLLPMAALALMATACDYQKNNTIKQKDLNEGQAHVYGVHPDSAAAQLKNTYTAKPELEVKANAIREKLFVGKSINQGN
jgi:thymidylate synthase